MKVLNQYPGSHHYWDEYLKTEYHCPNCDAKEVWEEQGPGDYYVGSDFICTVCFHSWTMQGPSKVSELNDLGILEQLRSGITHVPNTKKGN